MVLIIYKEFDREQLRGLCTKEILCLHPQVIIVFFSYKDKDLFTNFKAILKIANKFIFRVIHQKRINMTKVYVSLVRFNTEN